MRLFAIEYVKSGKCVVGFSFGEWVIWGLLTSQSGSAGFSYFPADVLLSSLKIVILFESICLRALEWLLTVFLLLLCQRFGSA